MANHSKVRGALTAGALAMTLAGGFAGAASAHDNVLGCSAPGGQQTAGALVGAVLGAVAGNSLSRGDTAGTVLGALAGGAAGSWVGCKAQRDEAEARYAGYANARHPEAYRQVRDEPRYRDRQDAERRAWRARYGEDRYAYGYGR